MTAAMTSNPPGFWAWAPRTLQQSIKEQLNERIDNLSIFIDSGKLNGENFAAAYCDRADRLW